MNPPEGKTIHLRYYAQMREQTGHEEESIQTQATTAKDLYEALRLRHDFPLEIGSLAVAVNDEMADMDSEIKDGDNVVFIPPVAGG